MNNFAEFINHNVAFTNKRFFDLFMLINEQADIVYKDIGIKFPVVASSTVLYLAKSKQGSLTEIAKGLGMSHQLISQRVKILLNLELITKHPAPNDKRKTIYTLTEKGEEQSKLLLDYCVGAEKAFNNLSETVGVDLLATINKAIVALHDTSFAERYDSQN